MPFAAQDGGQMARQAGQTWEERPQTRSAAPVGGRMARWAGPRSPRRRRARVWVSRRRAWSLPESASTFKYSGDRGGRLDVRHDGLPAGNDYLKVLAKGEGG